MKKSLMVCVSLVAILWFSTLGQSQTDRATQSVSATSNSDTQFDPSLINYLLQHRREVNLSPAQVATLQSILAEFRKQAVKKMADVQVADMELSELQAKGAPDFKAIEDKIRQSESIKSQLRVESVKADETAKAQLTGAQRQQLAGLAKMTPPRSGQQSSSEPNLQQQIQSVLDEKYKDQKLVELETSEAIVTKLLEWAKTFGIVIGVPLTILGALLGFFGIKSVSDMRTLADSGRKDISQSVTDAKQEISGLVGTGKQSIERTFKEAQEKAEAIKTKGENLIVEYKKLETQFAEVAALAQGVPALELNLSELASKVESIEEKIRVESSSTPAAKTKKLISALQDFQRYFQKMGFKAPKGEVKIIIDDKLRLNSHYILASNTVRVSPELVDDFDFTLHQYVHRALSAVNEPATDTPSLQLGGISEALADYFTCSFTGNPLVGEKSVHLFQKAHGKDKFPNNFLRNLKNNRSFNEIDPKDPLTTEVHSVGEIWGGAFWEVRELLGQALADKLLFATWKAMVAADFQGKSGTKFVKRLLEQHEQFEDGSKGKQIAAIFKRRDLDL
jgi:hypothetical protein